DLGVGDNRLAAFGGAVTPANAVTVAGAAVDADLEQVRDAAAVDEVEDRAVDAGAVLLAVPAAHTALAALAGGATLTWCNTATLSGRPALATLTALALSLSLSLSLVVSLVLSLALSLTLALALSLPLTLTRVLGLAEPGADPVQGAGRLGDGLLSANSLKTRLGTG